MIAFILSGADSTLLFLVYNNLKINDMKIYSNNWVDLNALQKNGEVIVAKSNAECFLATCELVNVRVDYKLSNGKVLFTLK